ncbi:MAG: CubicO group peptidase (beta-lactamase class C family) [Psychroserpens sp.]|jgi:CubicO group peptidase (beta-lactamase class C family)|uniref:serine hydrolase domain-containing protein n=1 Tax=Psychroserpens sp. TaxID=2020870 RepID=UPI0039E32A9B
MPKLKYLCLAIFVFYTLTTNSQNQLSHKIDSILNIYDTNNKPGLAISIIQNKDILYSKGFGLANLDYTIQNTDSTIFSLASISKQFTSAAIWSLIKEGKLNLEDNIHQFFPDFPNYANDIKIKHLLNHTSGFRNYHTLMYLSGFNYDRDYYDNQTVLNLIKRQKNLDNILGEKVVYSNTNYNLLALIIEKLSNQNLDDYLKDKILLPLGMKRTFVRVSHGKIIKNKAVGYQKKNNQFTYNTTSQLSYGAGSMGSHLKDMIKWMNMLNGQTPQFKSLAAFLKTQDTLINGETANYARGIMIDDYKGYEVASHSGFSYGGQSQLITVPEEKIGVIIMTNLQSINPVPLSYQILDMLLVSKENKSKKRPKPIVFQPQDLTQFIGDYIELNSDMSMRIAKANDTLKVKGSMGKTPIPLLQSDKNLFVRLNAQHIKYDFTKTDKHDLIVSFGGTPFYFKRTHLITKPASDLNEYVGNYFSEELKTTYTFSLENKALKLSYNNNLDITLHPVEINKFGNHDRTLYHFTTNKSGKIIGLLLSCDGQVKNIEFLKDQTQD